MHPQIQILGKLTYVYWGLLIGKYQYLILFSHSVSCRIDIARVAHLFWPVLIRSTFAHLVALVLPVSGFVCEYFVLFVLNVASFSSKYLTTS